MRAGARRRPPLREHRVPAAAVSADARLASREVPTESECLMAPNQDETAVEDASVARRSHYQHLSHDALVAIVVELLDERDRLAAALKEDQPGD